MSDLADAIKAWENDGCGNTARVAKRCPARAYKSATPSRHDYFPLTSADDAGHQHEDTEEQEGRTGSQPSEDNEPIVQWHRSRFFVARRYS
jgi:hypothetical protein